MPAHDPPGEHVDDEGDLDEPAQVLCLAGTDVRVPLARRTPLMPRSSSPHNPSSTRSSIAPNVIAGRVWVGRSVCRLELEPELHGQPPRSLGKAL
jgi:hypothetical protein